jgi:hypothetical protein
LPDPAGSPATGALRHAIITDRRVIAGETIDKLRWLIGPYIEER